MIRSKLTGLGFAALAAQNVVGTVTKGITAAGTTQATATAVYDDVNQVTTTPASSGVILRSDLGPGDTQEVNNYGANALLVYPPVGGTIQNGSTNAGYSVGAGKNALFRSLDGSNFSALLSS